MEIDATVVRPEFDIRLLHLSLMRSLFSFHVLFSGFCCKLCVIFATPNGLAVVLDRLAVPFRGYIIDLILSVAIYIGKSTKV